MNISKIFYTPQNYYKTRKFDELRNSNLSNHSEFSDKIAYSYPKNYYISFKGEDFKQKLEHKLNTASEEEIYLFLYNELKHKAEENRIFWQYVDDIIQDAVLSAFILLGRKDLPMDTVISRIDDICDKIRPDRATIKRNCVEVSLSKNILDGKKTLLDVIPDDENHRLKYLGPPDEEKRKKTRIEIDDKLSKTNLNNRQNLMLQERYSDKGTVSFDALAEKYGISTDLALRIVKQAIIKVQIANDCLSDSTKEKIAILGDVLGLDTKTIQAMAVKYPFILTSSPEVLKNNIVGLAEKFKDDGLTYDKYILAAIKQPQLFFHIPETVESNTRGVVEKFKDNGLTTEKYLKAAIKHPGPFYHSPETTEKNIKDVVKKFECNGLTLNQYIQAALKYPTLFSSSPETVEKNINGIVDIFKNDGLTKEKYIHSILKRPCLFSFLPETVENNIRGVVKEFEDNGLTTKQYLHSAILQPSLFYRSPAAIKKNIKDLVKKFQNQGLTLNDYLKAVLKQPSLFTMSADTVAEHIDLLRFAEFNRGNEIDNKESFNKILQNSTRLCYSSDTLVIKTVVIPKMFENSRVPKSLQQKHLKENLKEYLKNNPDKKYVIKVKNIQSDTDCIDLLNQTLTEISMKALGRDDVFEIKTEFDK